MFLQNTGINGRRVVMTNTEATMISPNNYSYGPLVPVRLFHEDGSFTDYDAEGRAI